MYQIFANAKKLCFHDYELFSDDDKKGSVVCVSLDSKTQNHFINSHAIAMGSCMSSSNSAAVQTTTRKPKTKAFQGTVSR